MAQAHQYIGFENINLNTSQRTTLFAVLTALGPLTSPQPCFLMQARLRLDSDAIIAEALFDENKITIVAVKQWLADIFSIELGDISHDTITQSFAGGDTPVTTFTYAATNYIRMGAFGGFACGWKTSHGECLGYLSLYQSEWEGET